MELLLGLLKNMSTALSPSEFLMMLIIAAASMFFVIRFILKYAKGSIGVISLLTGEGSNKKSQSEARIEEIYAKLDSMVSKPELHAVQERILGVLDEIRHEAKSHDVGLTDQLKTLSLLKLEVENSFSLVEKQMDAIQLQIKAHDLQDEANFKALKDNLVRGQELMNRVIAQLEKIDEFIKNAVPEFRSYHKELTKEISELSKDVGIMDRVLQSQINTHTTGITLR